MPAKRTILTLLIGISIIALSALSLQDLQDRVSALTSPEVIPIYEGDRVVELDHIEADEQFWEEANQLIIQFIQEEDDLDDVEEAAYFWLELMPDRCEDWLQQQASLAKPAPRLLYLWMLLDADGLSRINFARQLIQSHPDEVYGYRLLFLTYAENLPLTLLTDDEDAAQELLATDIPLLFSYYQKFKSDSYHRLAGIFAHNQRQELDSAKELLHSAFFARDKWIFDIDIYSLQPVSEYHELLAYLLQLIEDTTYPGDRVDLEAELREYLGEYYFENHLYEQAVDVLTTASGGVSQYLYQRYMLVSSLLQIGDKQRAAQVILFEDNVEDAILFADFWQNYINPELYPIYQTALEGNDSILARYLLGALEPEATNSLLAARQIIADDPAAALGYKLLSDTYWNYFADTTAEDPDLGQWQNEFSQDRGRIGEYYIRYPDDPDAKISHLLLQIMSGNSQQTMDMIYQNMEEIPVATTNEAAKIAANINNYDLLWQINSACMQQMEQAEYIGAEDIPTYEIIFFCQILYGTEHYDELIARVKASPDWLHERDIQYMMVNSYLIQEIYGEAIALLHIMLDAQTIDPNEVLMLRSLPLPQHPDWQALEDYALSLQADAPIEDVEEEMPAPVSEDPDPQEGAAGIFKAPDWTLSDIDGELVSLADFRGQIVILDFWATWCSPCIRTMPVLHEWMTTRMPEGVQVFSINIWEKDPSAHTLFMEDYDYAMRILIGDNKLANDYNIKGIPYIVVIDGEGMVRYTDMGFDSRLPDKLSSWVAQLKEEK